MKSYLISAAVIAAFATGGLYARWQVTEDCMNLGGFKAGGKVYVCGGMTETVQREVAMDLSTNMKRPL